MGRTKVHTNGTEFINQVVKASAEEHNIAHTTVSPYQANPIERVNRILKTIMISFIEQESRMG